MRIYLSVDPAREDAHQVLHKVQSILLLLLEYNQLDILLFALEDEIFCDILSIFEDIHRKKCPDVDYKKFYQNQTHFINYYDFHETAVTSIKMRYKLLFLKDYIFCDHPSDEFLNFLSGVDLLLTLVGRNPDD